MANVGKKKNRIITELYNLVSKKGKLTKKPNKLDQKAKIYTKRIRIDYNIEDDIVGKYLSLSCDNKEFKESKAGDLKLSVINKDKKWVSLFVNSFGIKELNQLFEHVMNRNKNK